MPPRSGFIVKNAVDVGSDLDIAEPDALDFNLLGNARYGVITGCDVTVAGPASWTINVAAGLYVVNGMLTPGGGQVTLQTDTAASPRFDLIVGDAAGHVSGLPGTPSPNPIFPQYDDTVCVFAAVYVTPGANPPTQDDVTDKRVMLMDRFTSAINSGYLLQNVDPGTQAPLFSIDYKGQVRWDGDTFLEQAGSKTLKITENLQLVGDLQANDMTVTGGLTVTGDVTADNLKAGYGSPLVAPIPGLPGDLYRDKTTGMIWAYENGVWQQLSTTPIPAGFTMTGFVSSAPPGWLLVDGKTHTKAEVGGLWQARPDWQIDANTMKLPDATNCFFAWGNPGKTGGNAGGTVSISTANLPPHKHLTSPTGNTNPAGSHSHSIAQGTAGAHSHSTAAGQGSHSHTLVDPGHFHHWVDGISGGAFIATMWGGQNKLDGLFNDASHTYAVEPVDNTRSATTGVSIQPGGADVHTHTTDSQGSHTHTLTIGSTNTDHVHAISEATVGGGQPLNILPPFIGMFLYVKT